MTGLWHHHPAVRSGGDLTLGERAADVMRNAFGSWSFVGGFLLFMAVWMTVNTAILGSRGFDKYPYILLNLSLSMMAGLQGALILIAAKRADRISAEIALHTERNTDDIKALLDENTDLTQQVHLLATTIAQQTATLDEIHRHVAAITPQAGAFPPPAPPAPPSRGRTRAKGGTA